MHFRQTLRTTFIQIQNILFNHCFLSCPQPRPQLSVGKGISYKRENNYGSYWKTRKKIEKRFLKKDKEVQD